MWAQVDTPPARIAYDADPNAEVHEADEVCDPIETVRRAERAHTAGPSANCAGPSSRRYPTDRRLSRESGHVALGVSSGMDRKVPGP
jgi:hypothetical protein